MHYLPRPRGAAHRRDRGAVGQPTWLCTTVVVWYPSATDLNFNIYSGVINILFENEFLLQNLFIFHRRT